jgi:hypothetical protein
MEQSHEQGRRFMRSGRAAKGEAELSANQHQRATKLFHRGMIDFGYLPQPAAPTPHLAPVHSC